MRMRKTARDRGGLLVCVCVNDRGGKRLGLSEKRTSFMYVVLMGPKSFATVAPRDKRHNWGSLCAFVFDYMSVCMSGK